MDPSEGRFREAAGCGRSGSDPGCCSAGRSPEQEQEVEEEGGAGVRLRPPGATRGAHQGRGGPPGRGAAGASRRAAGRPVGPGGAAGWRVPSHEGSGCRVRTGSGTSHSTTEARFGGNKVK